MLVATGGHCLCVVLRYVAISSNTDFMMHGAVVIICVFFLSVVVLGFEKETYVVFEGQLTEVCIAVLNRSLTNNEHREFTVSTSELTATSKNNTCASTILEDNLHTVYKCAYIDDLD